MRIGFDAKRLFFNKTGLGIYARELLTGLQQLNQNHEYLLFAKNPEESAFFSDFKDYRIIKGKGPFWRTWSMTGDIVASQCDLFHGLSHEIPLFLSGKCPSVVTIHDVIFKREPHLFPKIDRWIYDKKWDHSCTKASKIIAVSKHTKSDLMEFYGVSDDKINVISPPINLMSNSWALDDAQSILEKYRLPKEYFLFVGAISKRKNLHGIVEAMHQLKADLRIPVVVVGTGSYEGLLREKIQRLNLSSYFIFIGHVANGELPALYASSRALIYPSFYEGFGIPIVEALNCGTPVITSNISSMPEVAGSGALLIDPYVSDSITLAMEKILCDGDLAGKLVQAGKTHIQQFSTERVCTKMMDVYLELVQ